MSPVAARYAIARTTIARKQARNPGQPHRSQQPRPLRPAQERLGVDVFTHIDGGAAKRLSEIECVGQLRDCTLPFDDFGRRGGVFQPLCQCFLAGRRCRDRQQLEQ
jgi:hypothetical protein